MSKKHNSWKDNEIVNCHLLTRNLASLWYGSDGPTHWCMSFPRFSLLMLLNCPSYMCRSLTAQKVYITYRFKTSFVYCSLKHLNNGGSIQNDYTDSNCVIFYRRNKCIESSQ